MRVEIYGCSVFTDLPTVPSPEMTTKANREEGRLAANKGNRKTEGVNVLAVVLPVVLSILIAAVALGVFFYWKRRAQRNVDIKSVAYQTGTNELNYAVNKIYDDRKSSGYQLLSEEHLN